MSEEYQRLLAEGEPKERVVCDYISGMTDQYLPGENSKTFLSRKDGGAGNKR